MQGKENNTKKKITRTIYQGTKKLSAGKMCWEENKDRWKLSFKKISMPQGDLLKIVAFNAGMFPKCSAPQVLLPLLV